MKFNTYLFDGTEVELYDIITNALTDNKLITLGVLQTDKKISFINNLNPENVVTTHNWNENSGHAVFITGISKEYIHVSSWGKEYIIKISDLVNNQFSLDIFDFGGN